MSEMAFGIKREAGSDEVTLAVAPVGEGLEYDGNHDIINDAMPYISSAEIMPYHQGNSESEAHFSGDISIAMIQEVKDNMSAAGYVEEEILWM